MISSESKLRPGLQTPGNLRHRHLMGKAFLRFLKARDHRQDRLTVLDRLRETRHGRAPDAHAVHLVDDRDGRVTGRQEVGVQRVRDRFVDGARRGDQRLADDLAAVDALAAEVALLPAEHVDFERLLIQQFARPH